jgi:uncharacterized protein YbgA (DUF1722 family)/uncharacterized protein YbbK (DUF523 family)
MRSYERPIIVSSKCVEFEPCRYNGLMISSGVVDNLRNYADFIPVCPEVEIGLGVPRDPVRIVDAGRQNHLYQPKTGKCFTSEMEQFSEQFLNRLNEIDGFILKNRSPSCGIKNVKRYHGFNNPGSMRDSVGFFAEKVKSHFPHQPAEDEGRLRNISIREDFFTKIFTLADFRRVKNEGSFQDLLDFHSRNKFLLMAFNQENMHSMGRLLSSANDSLQNMKNNYCELLMHSLSENSKTTSNSNVLMHSLGYFSKMLTRPEKAFFLENLDKYREGRIPLMVLNSLIKSWIIRFGSEYLEKQTFFNPYPDDLMQVSFIYDKMR